jgi:hypothetical protein
MSTLVKRRMTTTTPINYHNLVAQVATEESRKRNQKLAFSAFKKVGERDAELKILYSPAPSIKNESTLCSGASIIDDE